MICTNSAQVQTSIAQLSEEINRAAGQFAIHDDLEVEFTIRHGYFVLSAKQTGDTHFLYVISCYGRLRLWQMSSADSHWRDCTVYKLREKSQTWVSQSWLYIDRSAHNSFVIWAETEDANPLADNNPTSPSTYPVTFYYMDMDNLSKVSGTNSRIKSGGPFAMTPAKTLVTIPCGLLHCVFRRGLLWLLVTKDEKHGIQDLEVIVIDVFAGKRVVRSIKNLLTREPLEAVVPFFVQTFDSAVTGKSLENSQRCVIVQAASKAILLSYQPTGQITEHTITLPKIRRAMKKTDNTDSGPTFRSWRMLILCQCTRYLYVLLVSGAVQFEVGRLPLYQVSSPEPQLGSSIDLIAFEGMNQTVHLSLQLKSKLKMENKALRDHYLREHPQRVWSEPPLQFVQYDSSNEVSPIWQVVDDHTVSFPVLTSGADIYALVLVWKKVFPAVEKEHKAETTCITPNAYKFTSILEIMGAAFAARLRFNESRRPLTTFLSRGIKEKFDVFAKVQSILSFEEHYGGRQPGSFTLQHMSGARLEHAGQALFALLSMMSTVQPTFPTPSIVLEVKEVVLQRYYRLISAPASLNISEGRIVGDRVTQLLAEAASWRPLHWQDFVYITEPRLADFTRQQGLILPSENDAVQVNVTETISSDANDVSSDRMLFEVNEEDYERCDGDLYRMNTPAAPNDDSTARNDFIHWCDTLDIVTLHPVCASTSFGDGMDAAPPSMSLEELGRLLSPEAFLQLAASLHSYTRTSRRQIHQNRMTEQASAQYRATVDHTIVTPVVQHSVSSIYRSLTVGTTQSVVSGHRNMENSPLQGSRSNQRQQQMLQTFRDHPSPDIGQMGHEAAGTLNPHSIISQNDTKLYIHPLLPTLQWLLRLQGGSNLYAVTQALYHTQQRILQHERNVEFRRQNNTKSAIKKPSSSKTPLNIQVDERKDFDDEEDELSDASSDMLYSVPSQEFLYAPPRNTTTSLRKDHQLRRRTQKRNQSAPNHVGEQVSDLSDISDDVDDEEEVDDGVPFSQLYPQLIHGPVDSPSGRRDGVGGSVGAYGGSDGSNLEGSAVGGETTRGVFGGIDLRTLGLSLFALAFQPPPAQVLSSWRPPLALPPLLPASPKNGADTLNSSRSLVDDVDQHSCSSSYYCTEDSSSPRGDSFDLPNTVGIDDNSRSKSWLSLLTGGQHGENDNDDAESDGDRGQIMASAMPRNPRRLHTSRRRQSRENSRKPRKVPKDHWLSLPSLAFKQYIAQHRYCYRLADGFAEGIIDEEDNDEDADADDASIDRAHSRDNGRFQQMVIHTVYHAFRRHFQHRKEQLSSGSTSINQANSQLLTLQQQNALLQILLLASSRLRLNNQVYNKRRQQSSASTTTRNTVVVDVALLLIKLYRLPTLVRYCQRLLTSARALTREIHRHEEFDPETGAAIVTYSWSLGHRSSHVTANRDTAEEVGDHSMDNHPSESKRKNQGGTENDRARRQSSICATNSLSDEDRGAIETFFGASSAEIIRFRTLYDPPLHLREMIRRLRREEDRASQGELPQRQKDAMEVFWLTLTCLLRASGAPLCGNGDKDLDRGDNASNQSTPEENIESKSNSETELDNSSDRQLFKQRLRDILQLIALRPSSVSLHHILRMLEGIGMSLQRCDVSRSQPQPPQEQWKVKLCDEVMIQLSWFPSA